MSDSTETLNEDPKSEKFVKLANKRVNKAIKDIQLIGNLANPHSYHYTEEQAKKIVKSLLKEVESVKTAFLSSDGASDTAFRL